MTIDDPMYSPADVGAIPLVFARSIATFYLRLGLCKSATCKHRPFSGHESFTKTHGSLSFDPLSVSFVFVANSLLSVRRFPTGADRLQFAYIGCNFRLNIAHRVRMSPQ